MEHRHHWEFCDTEEEFEENREVSEIEEAHINKKQICPEQEECFGNEANREIMGKTVDREVFEIKEDLNKFRVEIPSSSRNVLDKQSRRVCCTICNQFVTLHNFSRHMKRVHRKPEFCIKCKLWLQAGQVNKHQDECLGEEYPAWTGSKLSRGQTEQFCPAVEPSKALVQEDIAGSNSEFKISSTLTKAVEPMECDIYGESTNNTNNEVIKLSVDKDLDSFVKLRMLFVGDSTISQWMRLKSSLVVWRAMKKFARLVNVPFNNLQFYWREERLSGDEPAKILDGEMIVVKRCV